MKSNPQQFRQWFLTCDSEHLTSGILTPLHKSLPNADELKKLSELKDEINDLLNSEQYFCAVSLYFPNELNITFIDKRYKTNT